MNKDAAEELKGGRLHAISLVAQERKKGAMRKKALTMCISRIMTVRLKYDSKRL